MAIEVGIRSYGPGKFYKLIDSYLYEISLNGGPDREASYGEGNGWYGFMNLNPATKSEVHVIASEADDELTDEEVDLLSESVAVIFFERSDGIVEADWFSDMDKAEAVWDEIEADTEGDDEDEEDDEEEDD